MSEKFSIKRMPKPQRYGFYFLSFLALGIVFLWIWQFNYRLSSSFMPDKDSNQTETQEQEMFSEFQDFDSYLEDESIFNPLTDEEEVLFNPDDIPEETVNIPFKDPIIGDEFKIDSDNYEDLLMDALSGEASPDALRELLLGSGLERSMVDGLNDEELMEVYQEVLKGQSF
jgi:hypothetical protein